MSDVYVYHFMRRGPAGENILSKRRATLETIKGKGEAVMESQIVVDRTEVDGNGFLIGGIDNESHPMDELWAEITVARTKSQFKRQRSADIERKWRGRPHLFASTWKVGSYAIRPKGCGSSVPIR